MSDLNQESGPMEARKRRFAELASRVPHTLARDLFLDHPIDAKAFEALQWHVRMYISACLMTGGKILSSDEILERLSADDVDLPNKTPNGLLMPKAEVALEFTTLHKCFAQIMTRLRIENITDSWSLPINVRIVLGKADAAILNRPFAASKIHSDVWAGEPADAVILNIPVLGDIARTSLEWLELPPQVGESHLKLFRDFSEAEFFARQATRIDVAPKLGHIYFSDCALLHRTVRANGGCRVSIDLRFRLKSDASYKTKVEELSGPSRLSNYITFEQWRSIGERTVMVVDETMAECRNRYRSPQPGYGVGAPYRLVDLGLGT